MIWFLIGGGFLGLGAFFLWYVCGRSRIWSIVAGLVPVSALLVWVTFVGETEMALSLLWGVVIVNLALVGVLSLCFGIRLARGDGLLLVWLVLGIVGCWLVSGSGQIGVYSGWGLLIVGLVILWQSGGRQPEIARSGKFGLRHVVCWIGVLGLLLVGAWLLVWQRAELGVIWGWVLGLFVGIVHGVGICSCKFLRHHAVRSLLLVNSLLVTLGMGLLTVLHGGLHLTQSVHVLVLPWCVGLALLTVGGVYLPKKTTRWWGGLMVVLCLILVCGLLFR